MIPLEGDGVAMVFTRAAVVAGVGSGLVRFTPFVRVPGREEK
ncbi:hypothetical protein [Streptomyces sp. NPDC049881]